jgi:hypothetical protein
MTHAIIAADLLAYLRGNRWIVQNGELLHGAQNSGAGVLLNVGFPHFDQAQSEARKVIAFGRVVRNRALLRRAQSGVIVNTGIGVPVCAVDLNNRAEVWQVEVNASNEPAVIPTDSMLMDRSNAESSEDAPNFVLNRGNTRNLTRCNSGCSRRAQFGFRLVGMVRGSVPAPRFPTAQRAGRPVVITDGVWFGNNALRQTTPPSFVVALTGTIFGSVLRLVMGTCTGYRLAADRTLHGRAGGLALGAQPVGTRTAASSLATMLQALFVGLVSRAAHWTDHRNHAPALHTRSTRGILPHCAAMGKVWDGAQS